MKIALKDFRVAQGKKVNLARWPTKVKPFYTSKTRYRQLLDEYREELSNMQNVLYAHDRYALLLIFQGMDTAGKDGAIRHVMSGVNPQGCQVFSFKQPSSEELDHDFLWRTNQRLPERGRIGIFNRSYYEEVLVARVLPDVIARQRLPEEFVNPRTIWQERFRDIANMEDYLHRNGTRIIKFFLHISKEEQRQRFLARIDAPDKNWKLGPADIEMRERWDDFQHAYADCLGATSTKQAPWYVVPADDKRNARLIISQAIVETMKTLKMSYPEPTEKHRLELKQARSLLTKNSEV
ncbi:MAG: polyphosphate kinase 2 family protein [Verrucomicrobia bacterium]|nr:polyphosphate kinase 2 family protein [Verrucomicrobiota bacterium]